MMALTFIAIVFLYLGAFIWAGIAARTWLARFKVWGLLSIPLILWLWDYPVIQYRHEQACAKDGGLRVLIQPEKTDRIQLDGKQFDETSAKGILFDFYPKIQVVDVIDDPRISNTYFSYTIDPATLSTNKRDYKYKKNLYVKQTSESYVIAENYEDISSSGSKRQTILSRDGKVYAKWTSYKEKWNGSGILPNGWECFSVNETHRSSYYQLIELILN